MPTLQAELVTTQVYTLRPLDSACMLSTQSSAARETAKLWCAGRMHTNLLMHVLWFISIQARCTDDCVISPAQCCHVT